MLYDCLAKVCLVQLSVYDHAGCACSVYQLPVVVVIASAPELYSRGNLDFAARREASQLQAVRVQAPWRQHSFHPCHAEEPMIVSAAAWSPFQGQNLAHVFALPTALQGQLGMA